MPGALSHLRICDFTGQLAGAGATRFLAAFGAQVIRIEDPVNQGRWDILRGMPPYVDERCGVDLGGPFNNHNVEKLGVTLNLRTERGKWRLPAPATFVVDTGGVIRARHCLADYHYRMEPRDVVAAVEALQGGQD